MIPSCPCQPMPPTPGPRPALPALCALESHVNGITHCTLPHLPSFAQILFWGLLCAAAQVPSTVWIYHVHLSIHLLINTWVVSTLCPLQIKLPLNSCVQVFVWTYILLLLLDKFLGLKLLDHTVSVCSTFKPFSKVGVPFYILTSNVLSSRCSTSFVFLILAMHTLCNGVLLWF